MPCFRCGGRESDPARGPSPWKRGVRGGSHVLVCPACQSDPEWPSELDHCPSCDSWRLVRELGQVRCRRCGKNVEPDVEKPARRRAPAERERAPEPEPRADLAAEVTAALDRLTRRNTSSGA